MTHVTPRTAGSGPESTRRTRFPGTSCAGRSLDGPERRSPGNDDGPPSRGRRAVVVAGPGFEPGKLSRRIYSPLPLAARATRRGCRPAAASETLQAGVRADGHPGSGRTTGATRTPPSIPSEEETRGQPVVRRREQDRPSGGRQRPQPGREGAHAALRLPRDGRLGVVGRRGGDHGRGRHRGALHRRHRRLQGEADQARASRSRRSRSASPRCPARPTGSPARSCRASPRRRARRSPKLIRDEGPKGIQAQVQDDQLRVTGKKKDDLQDVISLLKGHDFGIALQFTNYR